MATPPPLLTINQVAERLQLDRRTVQKAIRIGRLEAVLIFRQWRISEEALATYIASCTPVVQYKKRKSA